MTQHVANQVKVDFQLDQLPYTFQYIGEDITIEEVEVGNPTTIVVKETFLENRSYNGLNIDANYFRFSGSQLHEMEVSTHGVWVDDDGNEVDQPMSIEEASSLLLFTTEQHFTVFPADDGTLFEPTFLFVEGYSIETNLIESLKISLN
ncbi:hypothetical protein H1D32_11910 [Anaerobacillus sp. CMMVII]|uniref:hypothetical protein n=1 Tax=Anaerobacillus sp. CMMVII TaxID=2755588 RepID=UPI0021B7F1A6|nr:hypothetical protein [Anaerobacillus sp. CMMVII]MCT8138394.1 hypothetical protein [Anaerobacillus sp. CMMVII]